MCAHTLGHASICMCILVEIDDGEQKKQESLTLQHVVGTEEPSTRPEGEDAYKGLAL